MRARHNEVDVVVAPLTHVPSIWASEMAPVHAATRFTARQSGREKTRPEREDTDWVAPSRLTGAPRDVLVLQTRMPQTLLR